MTALAFQTSMRQAAVDLLTGYVDSLDEKIKLQVYRARPASLFPPTAFVDRLSETLTFVGMSLMRRVPTATVVVVHGLFDSGEAVDQRDAFVDGFLDYVREQFHAAGANTLIGGVSVEDDPNYIPDWLPVEKQRAYYATVINLEGLALD